MKALFCFSALVLLGFYGCNTVKNSTGNTSAAGFPEFSTEGHRGGRGLMPENTILAMRKAIDLGVTTLEMDTHITKDNEVVVTHDDYLSPAFMQTPDGREIPQSDAKKYVIYQMDYGMLKQFDLGSKYYSNFPDQKKIKTYIPRLADLIDSVQLYAKGKKQFFYNIETKCSDKSDGVLHPDPEKFVKLLMDVIEQKKITPYVVIQSFDKRTIQIIHQKYPQVRTSYLIDNKKSFEENIKDLGYDPFIYSPAFKLVTADLVKKCHDRGIRIIPWTVNTKEDIAGLKLLSVDGIISDYPNLLVN
ncbi:glycerophosphodiester phosphodiesterase family protein [Pedobacter metabolipauper]|uniref:Glycerophosphoryl diester phosphodiesterase n=1 Tax=Pedobacter metabolipauper TaxID=425513 RepID=A0A4R6ST96_9SPHI|nr:glycerophosphodiester phosphodiesterase family protein [Pedobacter metabolipauper]TDQ07635.1 glycerophosphoryl diester phosphodiesterase [Pedobacter metabolipauper]